MTRSRIACAATLALALTPLAAATASAARRPQGPPPPPKAAGGAKVTTLAQGVPTPTAFAFAGTTTFVAGGGAEDGSAPGGVYTVARGQSDPRSGLSQVGLRARLGRENAVRLLGPQHRRRERLERQTLQLGLQSDLDRAKRLHRPQRHRARS